MLKSIKILYVTFGVVFVMLPAYVSPVSAQQNPFVGTWSTTQPTPAGPTTFYVDYFPNGALHMSTPVVGPRGGYYLHECGAYRFDPAQSTIQYVFNSYTPKLPGEAGPGNLNQAQNLHYTFENPGLLVFNDNSSYVRQAGNPWPLPQGGCQ